MSKLQPDIKEETYQKAISKIKNLKDKLTLDSICNTLYDMFENWNFFGFYILNDNELEISFYKSDKIPCSPINMGGVCGQSLNSRKIIIVPNVSKFHGHIECDPNSKSEITIPFLNYVLDIDSKELDDFDEIDKKYLKDIIEMI